MIFQDKDMVIFADDMTGTLDTAVQFSKYGISVIAFPTAKAFVENEEWTYQVYVVNAATRHLQPREAYQVLFYLTSYVFEKGGRRIFKKTDSALRGNIGAELSAVLDASQGAVLHFAPAYPDMNRYTLQEIHYCDGVPVAQSVFGKDPFEPVIHSSVREIIRETSNVDIRFISKDHAEQGNVKPTIYIYEAKNNEDMKKICISILASGKKTLMAGCAGLALALADILESGIQVKRKLPKTDKVLVVSGSLNHKSLEQIEYLINCGFFVRYLDWDRQLRKSYMEQQSCGEFIDAVCNELCEKHISILATSGGVKNIERKELARMDVGETISYIISKILNNISDCVLVVFGGDTLSDIVSYVIKGGLIPVKEIMPGVPVSVARFKNGRECVVVSRSGGFGAADSMAEIINTFRK